MFFKKVLFFVCFCPLASQAFNFSEFTCFQDIKRYYPYLAEGSLDRQQQKRFFRCLHDSLELVVRHEVFTHDSSRDYFTKEEIFRMFNMYFEYPESLATRLTAQVFAIKKILIGGSMDKLKDQELRSLYNLMYDYQDIYFLLHKRLPVFKKALAGSAGLSSAERSQALRQIRKAFEILGKAYKRENIVYETHDLYRYGEYLERAGLVQENDQPAVRKSALFLHHLLEGALFPQKAIKQEGWNAALSSVYEAVNLFLYYKAYLVKNKPFIPGERTYRILRAGEILLSSLGSHRRSEGFPLNNLDQMLSVIASFLDGAGPAEDRSFLSFRHSQSIPLLTRALSCFSLDKSSEKNCKSKWSSRASAPVVALQFEDRRFEIFSDRITASPPSRSSAFIKRRQLEFLKRWLADYRKSVWEIHSGNALSVAKARQFKHWLSPFFGWDKNHRVEFGAFHSSKNYEKFYQLLSYQAFLPLLFFSYLPDGFFSSDQKDSPSISFKTWRSMMREISPALAVLQGKGGYDPSWRASLDNLFYFADSFLYSSNRDERLSGRELMDLTVHILEGVKTVKLAQNRLSQDRCLHSACAVEKIFKDPEILAAYPRFQHYLFPTQMDKYLSRAEAVLGGPEKPLQPFSLLPLFVLIQVAELNYELIDKNHSFNLESDELLAFAKKFEEQLAYQIPYLFSGEQARSFLMYSFQTGSAPFFKGDMLTPLKFSQWHLDSKSRRPFVISPNKFHFLVFDFYDIYRSF